MNCKDCDGEGIIYELIVVPTPNGPLETYEEAECETCEGAGEVESL